MSDSCDPQIRDQGHRRLTAQRFEHRNIRPRLDEHRLRVGVGLHQLPDPVLDAGERDHDADCRNHEGEGVDRFSAQTGEVPSDSEARVDTSFASLDLALASCLDTLCRRATR